MELNKNAILTIELTDRCNFNCRMCDHAGGKSPHNSEGGFMDKEIFSKILKDLEEFPVTLLTPYWVGESLLHPEFDEMMEELFEKNKDNRLFRHMNLNTNAALLTPETTDVLLDAAVGEYNKDTFVRIHFSLDAILPATYRKIKGESNLEQTYENVRYFLKKYSEMKMEFPKFNIALIVMKENRYEVSKFVNYWNRYLEELGLVAKTTYDWPEGVENGIYIRRLDDSCNQVEAEEMHKEVARELGLIKEIKKEERIIKTNAVLKDKHNKIKHMRRPCSGPFKTPIIHWNGLVTVCCFDVKLQHAAGNIKDKTLKEIWFDERIHKLRMAHITGNLRDFPACSGCCNLNTPMLEDEEILSYLKFMGEKEELWLNRIKK